MFATLLFNVDISCRYLTGVIPGIGALRSSLQYVATVSYAHTSHLLLHFAKLSSDSTDRRCGVDRIFSYPVLPMHSSVAIDNQDTILFQVQVFSQVFVEHLVVWMVRRIFFLLYLFCSICGEDKFCDV